MNQSVKLSLRNTKQEREFIINSAIQFFKYRSAHPLPPSEISMQTFYPVGFVYPLLYAGIVGFC